MRTAETSRYDALPFPRAVTDFVGREAELSRVRALLPREPLFLVYGVAGIGKSEFVYKIVEEARSLPALRRASTIALAARAGLRWEHLLSVLRLRLSVAASEPHESLADDLSAVARALSARPALVFIDDVHHLDAEATAEVLGYLARHVSRSRLFVASRLELLLPEGTPPPVICRLPPLSREATETLVANLSHVLGLSSPDPAEVLARSGGSPFYVRRELSDLRYAPRRDGDSLAAALRELSPALRRTLLLARHVRGRLSPADLPGEEALWELSRRFLIDVDRGVIMVHDLIREALRRAAAPEEIAEARRDAAQLLLRRADAAPADRAADVSLDVVEAAQLLLDAGEPTRAWEALDRHARPMARAALDHLALPMLSVLQKALPEQRQAVVLHTATILLRHARVAEARALLDELGAEGRRPPHAARYLRLSAAIARRTGALDRAAALLDEALGAAKDPREKLGVALQRACVQALRGEGAAARGRLGAALAEHGALAPEDQARIGWVWALSFLTEGRFEEGASTAAEAAGGTASGKGAEHERAQLTMLELFARCACDEVDAAAALLKRLQLHESATSALPAPASALFRGLVHHARGELLEARAALDEAHRYLLSHGDLLPAAVASHCLGLTLLGLGDLEGAHAAACRAAQMVADGGLASLAPHCAVLKARVHLGALRWKEAEALLVMPPEAPALVQAQAEALRAQLHALRGESEAALSALDRAASLSRQQGAEAGREVDLTAAEVLLLCGNAAGADERAERAQVYYEARGRRQPQAQAALVRAAALLALGVRAEGEAAAALLGEAEEHLGLAQALSERHGHALPWAPLVAVALYRRRGDERRARAELSAALRRMDATRTGHRPAESLEGRLLSWTAAARSLPADAEPCPPGIAALLRALGLLPPAEVVAAPHSPAAPEGANRALGHHDLVVDLRRTVIRAPGREDQVTGRPILCALLAHLAPNDGVYSAERLFYEVWGGREYHPLRHRNTIYVAITRLRRALQELLPGREVVETTPQGWRLSAGVSLCVLGGDASRPRPAKPAA
ncbi:AAA family ATPase [Polyangium jinanense]|uniref:AAA family ATPase n=1 Tax=Polyangium jinanense TaxID=2829994 RepID=A0A9X3X4S1_9BACT|nr:AAA family ATPase [Polyangium jinanense]MDC3982188.1 AAA family ATPase [Polyangium jinanense]